MVSSLVCSWVALSLAAVASFLPALRSHLELLLHSWVAVSSILAFPLSAYAWADIRSRCDSAAAAFWCLACRQTLVQSRLAGAVSAGT